VQLAGGGENVLAGIVDGDVSTGVGLAQQPQALPQQRQLGYVNPPHPD
jgi:hypothetical protein